MCCRVKQYDKAYKINPEVVIVVQSYRIKNKFPTPGYIFYIWTVRCNLGAEFVY